LRFERGRIFQEISVISTSSLGKSCQRGIRDGRGATSILKYSVINNPLNAKGLTPILLTYNGLRHV